MGTPEELAFLLQESGLDLVDASDVLHAIDRALAARSSLLPKGMTSADAWMARHGNPLASTEAAMLLAGMAGPVISMNLEITKAGAHASVMHERPKPQGCTGGHATAATLPIAICAAALDSIAKWEKIRNV